ncbi:hypothetical protein UFOVP143_52 [uncultured Caudovirales phage]|uniref:Uncharacterized protein n=1 Tax=uncultured Caudovirales phage TaxID=2100421 RepID=A0A6J7VJP7_9CAUD|nr:hypothetical protein UFOVP143_52 [uncultured Caudovirales phage]
MADLELPELYELVFGSPAGIAVLRDLASTTGFMASLPIGTSAELLIEHNTGRRFFGRLYEILVTTERGREAMAEALRPVATQE